jgi:hypothetical protein
VGQGGRDLVDRGGEEALGAADELEHAHEQVRGALVHAKMAGARETM